jgi:hypothetical protein
MPENLYFNIKVWVIFMILSGVCLRMLPDSRHLIEAMAITLPSLLDYNNNPDLLYQQPEYSCCVGLQVSNSISQEMINPVMNLQIKKAHDRVKSWAYRY